MNSQQKKISVIIPVYNTEDYLSRCLDSVINCNYENLEVICVNDGSNDNSAIILKKFEKKDSRIRVFDKENGGLSSARNAGISIATGEYVSFIDADDWIHPDYFKILTKIISEDIDAVICGSRQESIYSTDFTKYDEQKIKSEVWEVNSDTLFKDKKLEMFKVYSWGVLYKKEKIHSLFPQGVKVIEDNIFNLLNLPLYSKMVIVNLPLYFYFVNDKSIMHTYSCEDAFNGLIWFCKWLDENRNIGKKQKALIVEFLYKRSFYYGYVFTYLMSNRSHSGEEKDYLKKKDSMKEYAKKIYKMLEKHDECLNQSKKLEFHFFKKMPVCYSLMKFMKSGRVKEETLFSLAPNKLIYH